MLQKQTNPAISHVCTPTVHHLFVCNNTGIHEKSTVDDSKQQNIFDVFRQPVNTNAKGFEAKLGQLLLLLIILYM